MPYRIHSIETVRAADPDLTGTRAEPKFSPVNLPFVISIALVCAFGMLVCFTATVGSTEYDFSRQVGGVIVGIVIAIFIARSDYHQLSGYITLFLILNVVLIMSPHLPVIGVEVNGGRSWVNLGVRFQPGEFAKITVVLLAASVVARYGGRLDDPREYVKTLVILGIPFVCILTQPDLGTGLVYLFICGTALVIGGAKPRYMVITVAVIAALVVALFLIDPIADQIAGSDVLLKNYQRSRLLVFMDSSYDTSGDGYNLQQAKIAIGSGGLFGKGLFNDTQCQLGFVPEAPTDFVFCVLAEQFGFVGALLLIAMYAFVLVCTLRIARTSNDLFGTILVGSICGMWIFQIFENIGMDVGLMPITGIPLPFVSYGSSFMIVNFAMVGLIASVWKHNGKTTTNERVG